MKKWKKKTALELRDAVLMILDENDDAAMTTTRACKLPKEWRIPLVRAFNNFEKEWME